MIRQPEELAREGLESFCETVLGDLLSRDGYQSLTELADSLTRRIVLLDSPLRGRINLFLRRLASRGGTIRLGSGLKRFSRLPVGDREEILRRILGSSGSVWCGIAQSLYRQVTFAAAHPSGVSKSVPSAGESGDRTGQHSLFEIARVGPQQTGLACDWLVIGSGPAGSVMAAELAETGQSVLLVDQGSLFSDGSRLTESGASQRLIETFNAWSPDSESVVISAGRGFGGGSVVNWGTCLDPPPGVLGEWSEATGYDFLGGDVFRHSLFAVRQRLFVEKPETRNEANELLEDAARRLGHSVRPVETSTGNCPDCQGCQFGCSTGKKRDMRTTWLVDASRLGVFLLPDCRVNRLKLNGRKAGSAVAQIARRGADPQDVEIRFRHCVLAAGAIHTPSILMRSGFSSPHLGRHLALHPSVIVPAVFTEPIRWQGGPIQSCVVEPSGQSASSAAPVILENSFFPRGLAMMSFPWRSSRELAAMSGSLECWTGTLVLAGDRNCGMVSTDNNGRPLVQYRLGLAERLGLQYGIRMATQIMMEAGSVGVYEPGWQFGGARPGGSIKPQKGQMLKLWSAHQMGTCRMAGSPQQGVVDSAGRAFGLENVFVCDSSVFPSSIGVNPMVTVCATSHFLAQQIKQRVC